MADSCGAEPRPTLDYAEVVDAATLAPVRPARRGGPPARGRPLRARPAHRQRGGRSRLRSMRRTEVRALDPGPCATSTCSCWVRASPACRPRCGPPKGTGMGVGVLTKGELPQSTTRWAQGGVAAVLSSDPDSTDLHLADTLAAGAGLCDADAVRVLVDEGPARVEELIALGAMFDRDADGRLELAREGGHSLARVVHAGGAATGAEVERALVDAVERSAAAVYEHPFALDLIVEGRPLPGRDRPRSGGRPHRGAGDQRARRDRRRRAGVRGHDQPGRGHRRRHRHGAAGRRGGRRHRVHPVPPDRPAPPGHAAAAAVRGAARPRRAAAATRTASASSTSCCPATWCRGPRRRSMREQDVDHVWLDATGLEDFDERFPTIAAALREVGLDPRHRLAARRAGRALHVRRHRHRPRRRVVAARAVGGRRGGRAPGCTAPTGWPRTRCSRAWCSGRVRSRRSSGASSAPSRPARCGRCSGSTNPVASEASSPRDPSLLRRATRATTPPSCGPCSSRR